MNKNNYDFDISSFQIVEKQQQESNESEEPLNYFLQQTQADPLTLNIHSSNPFDQFEMQNLNSPNFYLSQNLNTIPSFVSMVDQSIPPTINQDNLVNNRLIVQQQEFIEPINEPTIVNMGATFDCGLNKLKLQEIAENCWNCEYNPKRFAALVMRIKSPFSTTNIFSSGKMFLLGCKDKKSSMLAAKKIIKILQNLGEKKAKLNNFKIVNIVASYDFKFPINLSDFWLENSSFCRYEPELFCGVVFSMIQPKVVFLIYSTGKVTFYGAKTKKDVHLALENISPLIEKFKR